MEVNLLVNRWHGRIGFVITVQDEIKPSKWVEKAIEKQYYGDILKNNFRWESGLSVNDDINISNRISVIADNYMTSNLQYMKYIEISGAFWKINSIDIQAPRLILEIGGIWNGKRADS